MILSLTGQLLIAPHANYTISTVTNTQVLDVLHTPLPWGLPGLLKSLLFQGRKLANSTDSDDMEVNERPIPSGSWNDTVAAARIDNRGFDGDD